MNEEKGGIGGDEVLAKSEFFRHDNAIFRRKPGKKGVGVDDVLVDGKFVPYKGDRIEPAMYGIKLPLAALKKLLKMA